MYFDVFWVVACANVALAATLLQILWRKDALQTAGTVPRLPAAILLALPISILLAFSGYVLVKLLPFGETPVPPPYPPESGSIGSELFAAFTLRHLQFIRWKDVGLWAFYFGMMLFGMAGQYFWKLKTFSRFNVGEFVRPLWVSFIVFTPFWTAANVDSVSYVAAAAAYQNGFFWKVVLDREEREVRRARSVAPKKSVKG